MGRLDYTEGRDPTKPLTDGRVWGVVAKPAMRINPLPLPVYALYPTPVLLSSRTWAPAPIPHKLGFPVQMHQASTATHTERARQDLENNQVGVVHGAESFFIDDDPDSPAYGRAPAALILARPDTLFTRSDGKDMDDMQLAGLNDFVIDYLITVLPPFDTYQSGGRSDRIGFHKEVFAKRMHAESFHAYFEQQRLLSALGGTMDWSSSVSPVSVTQGDQEIAPACGGCYSYPSKSGAPLVKCGGCGRRFYCDRACQKVDWKKHKQVCSKS